MREQLRLYRPGLIVEKRRRQRIIATGGDRGTLPDDQPLAWRELRRIRLYSWFGKLQWGWLGFFIVLWEVLYFLGQSRQHLALDIAVDSWSYLDPFSCLLMMLGVVATSVSASGLVAGERSRRSLEVLLVLPLPTTELIMQKLAMCRRVTRIFFALVALMSVGEAWSEMALGLYGMAVLHFALVLSISWIHLELAAWLSLAVSLHVHAQARAVIVSLGTIIVWCVAPFVILSLAWKMGVIDQGAAAWTWCELISPANVYFTMLKLNGGWIIEVLANALMYLIILVALRTYCLRRGNALLGRVG